MIKKTKIFQKEKRRTQIAIMRNLVPKMPFRRLYLKIRTKKIKIWMERVIQAARNRMMEPQKKL